MSSTVFVNLPVKDLRRSTEFFTALGYCFDPRFSDDNAGCLVLGDGISAMLLTEPFFKNFTKKEIVDATKATEAILCLGVQTRGRVDELVDSALAAGATPANEPMDEGFMYGRSFADPDGHLWEVMYLDPSAAQQQP